MIRSAFAHDFVLSPNTGPRRNGARVSLLILHYTGMASAERARDWLCNPVSHVSSHYLVDERGCITQMVGEEMRAWHAGVSTWRTDHDVNSSSVGIEIHNPGHTLGYVDFPEPQMRAVSALCRDILSRHEIAPRDVLAHSDVAPQRKIDPGEKFDWRRLNGQGIGHWVEPAPLAEGEVWKPGDHGEKITDLQRALADYGYGVDLNGIYDKRTKAVVCAFQRHFRPALVDGLADVSTVATLERLRRALEPYPAEAM